MDQTQPPVSEWIEATALAYVTEAYAAWRRRRVHTPTAPEPNMSVGDIKAYLDQCGRPADYRFCVSRAQYRMIQAALARLVKAGKLQMSLGHGIRERGREVRLYEPGDVA